MAGALTIDTLNNSAGVFAANNAFTGIAKAWVNFNGTVTGSFSPTASLNVSSITRSATGTYTITFSTPMSDVAYSFVGFCRKNDTASTPSTVISYNNSAKTTSSFQVLCTAGVSTLFDSPEVAVAVFR